MFSCLSIECIGDNDIFRKNRTYVALITGLDDRYGFKRAFIEPKKDYSKANSIGSRGVLYNYFLEHDKLYEVQHYHSWSRSERYYCVVNNDQELKLNKDEAIKWLKNI
jgi:hypothetical protein